MLALAIFLIAPAFTLAENSTYVGEAMILFEDADADASGDVTKPELQNLLMEEDTDGDGIVSGDEFVKFFSHHYETEENAKLFLSMIDKDRDGNFSQVDLDNLFFILDPNEDGISTEREFTIAIASLFRAVDIANSLHGKK